METAKDILEKHGINQKSTDSWFYEQALKALREIAGKSWEAGNSYGYNSGRGYDEVEDQGDRSTFMKSLFPLKDI